MTDATLHRRLHRPGVPPKIERDAELRAFVDERIDRQSDGKIMQAARDAFGPERAPSWKAIMQYRLKTRGRRDHRVFKIELDADVRAFVEARLDRMTFAGLAAAARREFGPARAPSKSALHRYSMETRGRRPPRVHGKIESDAELRAFIDARIDELTFQEVADEARSAFGAARAPSAGAIGRYWHRQRNLRANESPDSAVSAATPISMPPGDGTPQRAFKPPSGAPRGVAPAAARRET